MKNGFWIFIAAFVALGGSWCGFVLAPELQLGLRRPEPGELRHPADSRARHRDEHQRREQE